MIVILAGGKSERMGAEKPVLKVNGKEMLLRVHEKAERVSRTIVAVSKHTPKTKRLCVERGIEYIETEGKGYVEDLVFLLSEFRKFVSVSSDLPFIREENFKKIFQVFEEKGVNLTGVVERGAVENSIASSSLKHFLRASLRYKNFIVVGLNAVTSKTEEDEFVSLPNPFLVVNVNTPQDLRIADYIAKRFNPM